MPGYVFPSGSMRQDADKKPRVQYLLQVRGPSSVDIWSRVLIGA